MSRDSDNPLLAIGRFWPFLAGFFVVGFGVFVGVQPSLNSPRPLGDESPPVEVGADPEARARLWQDPLGTVRAHESALSAQGPRPGPLWTNTQSGEEEPLHRAAGELIDDKPAGGGRTLVLFVWIPAGYTFKESELRRRERYAALSAMNTAGYVPAQLSSKIKYLKVLEPSTRLGPRRAAVLVPFEWFKPNEGPRQSSTAETPRNPDQDRPFYESVCLLWVPDLRLSAAPGAKRLETVGVFKSCLDAKLAGPLEVGITGRIGSDNLAVITRGLYTRGLDTRGLEVCRGDSRADVSRGQRALDGCPLYVTFSTSPRVRTAYRSYHDSLQLLVGGWWRGYGPILDFVIGDDQRLADVLIRELNNRSPKRPARVALIAEWDTAYGREMPNYFQKLSPITYSYMRGLDGKTIGPAASRRPMFAADAPADQKPSRPTLDEAVGDSQVDYLRRLVENMKADTASGQPYEAVGVLGSDFYDKYLILKALRPHFPGAIFFTTDLDARLLQPGDYGVTRNLLIASHYGLCLHDQFQGRIPPFRSGYDTASYLGYLKALRFRPPTPLREAETASDPYDRTDRRLPVILTEVSSRGGFQLAPFANEDPPLPVHPNTDRFSPSEVNTRDGVLLGVMVLLVGLLILPLSRPFQDFFVDLGRLFRLVPAADPAKPSQSNWVTPLVLAVVITVGVLLGVWIFVLQKFEAEEPFVLFAGVSVWPTILLRYLAAALGVYFVVKCVLEIGSRNRKLEATLIQPASSTASPSSDQAPAARGLAAWWWRPRGPQMKVWHEFANFSERWLGRCTVLTAIYALLIVLVWVFFDRTELQPRGLLTWWTNKAVLWCTGLVIAFLLVFVMDRTMLAYRFVMGVIRSPDTWPEGEVTEDNLNRAYRLPKVVKLIRDATEVESGMIIYPFVVLLVLVVAHSSLFDNWHWDIPVVLVGLVIPLTALICALMLHRVARRAKEKAVDALVVLLLADAKHPQPDTRQRLEAAKQEIDDLHGGVYAGFYRDPVLASLIVPLGSSGLVLLERLLK